MNVKVRCGDELVERPLGELVVEALYMPFFLIAVLYAMRGGWGH